MILNNPQTQNEELRRSRGIGIALKSAGYFPSEKVRLTNIGHINTCHDSIYFDRALEEFFALIENYPQSFQDIICRLSKDELNQIIAKHYPDNRGRSEKWHNDKLLFNKENYFSQYQNRIAEEICMYQILHPYSNINSARDYIFELHSYHDDYKNGIDTLIQEKLQKYMQEEKDIDQQMKVVLEVAEELEQHMLSDLQPIINQQIQSLEAKLGIELSETDDATKPVKKVTKEQDILQIQLKALRQVQSRLIELSDNPLPPFNQLSPESRLMPPGYSDKPMQSHSEKVQIIAECITKQNGMVSNQFAKLNREPVEWWKGIGLFVASLPILILPVMLYSKKYLHTYQFWNLQKIALKSKDAKIFSEINLFNTVVKHVEEKKQTIKKMGETKKSLFFAARKLHESPPYEEHKQEKIDSSGKCVRKLENKR